MHHLHSLSDTRFQTAKVNFAPKRPQSTQLSNRDDIDKHRARTALHRSAFNEEFQIRVDKAFLNITRTNTFKMIEKAEINFEHSSSIENYLFLLRRIL